MTTSEPLAKPATNDFENSVRETIAECVKDMGFFWKVVNGEASPDELRQGATHYYSEVSVFIDLKLPERLRLAPKEAVDVREFFWKIYEEEHGDFVDGRDHASMWKGFCLGLGADEDELERRREAYSRRFNYLRELEPSFENMVTELAIMTAWESVGPSFSSLPKQALNQHYDVPTEAMEFFDIHSEDDIEHSNMAMELLLKYTDTDALKARALDAIRDTLRIEPYIGQD